MKKMLIISLVAIMQIGAMEVDNIRIRAQDNKKLRIQKSVAEASKTLKDLLEGELISEEIIEIPVPNYNQKTLKKLFQLVKLAAADKQETVQKILEKLRLESIQEILEMISAENYLDITVDGVKEALQMAVAYKLPLTACVFATMFPFKSRAWTSSGNEPKLEEKLTIIAQMIRAQDEASAPSQRESLYMQLVGFAIINHVEYFKWLSQLPANEQAIAREEGPLARAFRFERAVPAVQAQIADLKEILGSEHFAILRTILQKMYAEKILGKGEDLEKVIADLPSLAKVEQETEQSEAKKPVCHLQLSAQDQRLLSELPLTYKRAIVFYMLEHSNAYKFIPEVWRDTQLGKHAEEARGKQLDPMATVAFVSVVPENSARWLNRIELMLKILIGPEAYEQIKEKLIGKYAPSARAFRDLFEALEQ